MFRNSATGTNFQIDKNQFAEASKQIQINYLEAKLVDQVVSRKITRNKIMYQYQANIGQAKLHQQATKFGQKLGKLQKMNHQVCPCCQYVVKTQQYSLCQDTTDVELLKDNISQNFKFSSGIASFFAFLKMIIFYLLSRILITDGYNLYRNYLGGNNCLYKSPKICERVIWNYLSSANYTQQGEPKILDILNLITIVFSIIFFLCYRKRQYKFYRLIDYKEQSQNDYTIMVQNIPILDFPESKVQTSAKSMEFIYRRHLRLFFENKIKQWLDNKDIWLRPKGGTIQFDFDALRHNNGGELRSQQIVKSISLCHNLERLQRIIKMKQQLIQNYSQQKQKQEQIDNENFSRFSTVPNQVDFLNDCQIILDKQYANDNSVLFNLTHFMGIAFISFQYQHYRNYIIQQFSNNNKFLSYNNNYLKVSQAAHPNQIFWINLRVTQKQRLRRTLTSFLVLILVLIFSFFILGLLESQIFDVTKQVKKFIKKIEQDKLIQGSIILTLANIFVLAINYSLEVLSHKLSVYERHQTKTKETTSLIIKIIGYQFLNSAALYYFISLARSSTLTGYYGLVAKISNLFVVAAIIQPILYLIYWPDVFRRLKLWWNYRRNEDTDFVKKFQIKLNNQFQYPEFELSERYSYFMLYIYISSFYSYLVPVGVVITLFMFIIQFWITKINLFKRSSLKYTYDYNMTRYVFRIFQAHIIFFALGNFIFSFQLYNKISILNTISLVIVILYGLILIKPPFFVENILHGFYEIQKVLYDDCIAEGNFDQTYWNMNPATYLVREEDVTGIKGFYNPVKSLAFAIASPQKQK